MSDSMGVQERLRAYGAAVDGQRRSVDVDAIVAGRVAAPRRRVVRRRAPVLCFAAQRHDPFEFRGCDRLHGKARVVQQRHLGEGAVRLDLLQGHRLRQRYIDIRFAVLLRS